MCFYHVMFLNLTTFGKCFKGIAESNKDLLFFHLSVKKCNKSFFLTIFQKQFISIWFKSLVIFNRIGYWKTVDCGKAVHETLFGSIHKWRHAISTQNYPPSPPPSVTLNWVFYLHLHIACHKITPPTCMTSFMNDPLLI